MSRVMIVAGEASADLHGASLVRAVRRLAPEVEFFGVGGQNLRSAGVETLFDLENLAIMGLTEVLSGLGHARAALRALKSLLREDPPAAAVLIDYPDFNLRLARAAKRAGVPVFYYISPQLWAWRRGRVRQMARWVDRLAVVFPFEVDFYQQHGLEATFVGHPLLDVLPLPRPKAEVKAELGFAPDRPLLALLPGSRKSVVRHLLPAMVEAAGRVKAARPEVAAAVALADTLRPEDLAPLLAGGPADLRVVAGQTPALENAADAAVVASGTATVETALMQTPMVVVYRMGRLSYLLARLLVRTRHVAMANLIAGERVVPELLQKEVCPDRIAAEVERILKEPELRARMASGLSRVREKLGRPGASRRAAELLLATMGRRVEPPEENR